MEPRSPSSRHRQRHALPRDGAVDPPPPSPETDEREPPVSATSTCLPQPEPPTPPAIVNQLQEVLHAEFTFTSFLLRVMAAFSAVRLAVDTIYSSRRETLMSEVGFVDYSPTSSFKQLTLLPYVVVIVVWMLCELATYLRLVGLHQPLHRVYNRALLVAGFSALVGSVGFLLYVKPFPQKTLQRLEIQIDAVANFNRGYCQTWCQRNSEGLKQGDCSSDIYPVFNDIIGTIVVGDWCKRGISEQNYAMAANHDGVAPFEALAAGGGDLSTEILLGILCVGYTALPAIYLVWPKGRYLAWKAVGLLP